MGLTVNQLLRASVVQIHYPPRLDSSVVEHFLGKEEVSWLERTTHNRKVKSSSLFLATMASRSWSTHNILEVNEMASKSADIRPGITLACTECKERNYITTKNRRNTPDRLELSKFCPRCGKHTLHRETR